MTPKEKAKELYNSFYWDLENNYLAKQCALIAANEILKAVNGMVDEESGYSADGYYLEVKQEIINL